MATHVSGLTLRLREAEAAFGSRRQHAAHPPAENELRLCTHTLARGQGQERGSSRARPHMTSLLSCLMLLPSLDRQRIRKRIAHPRTQGSNQCMFQTPALSASFAGAWQVGRTHQRVWLAQSAAMRTRGSRDTKGWQPMSLRLDAISTMYLRSHTAFATGLLVLNVIFTVSSEPCTTRAQRREGAHARGSSVRAHAQEDPRPARGDAHGTRESRQLGGGGGTTHEWAVVGLHCDRLELNRLRLLCHGGDVSRTLTAPPRHAAGGWGAGACPVGMRARPVVGGASQRGWRAPDYRARASAQ